MTSTKTLAISLAVIVALTMIGLQPSAAQPGANFENRGELQSEGFSQPPQFNQSPTSGQLGRHQAIEACVAQSQQEAPGVNNETLQRRYLIYSSCMANRGLQP
jgi:hypothetical protein